MCFNDIQLTDLEANKMKIKVGYLFSFNNCRFKKKM